MTRRWTKFTWRKRKKSRSWSHRRRAALPLRRRRAAAASPWWRRRPSVILPRSQAKLTPPLSRPAMDLPRLRPATDHRPRKGPPDSGVVSGAWTMIDHSPLATHHSPRTNMARTVILFTGQWTDLPLAELAPKAGEWGYQGLDLCCWGDHFEVQRALNEADYCQNK